MARRWEQIEELHNYVDSPFGLRSPSGGTQRRRTKTSPVTGSSSAQPHVVRSWWAVQQQKAAYTSAKDTPTRGGVWAAAQTAANRR
ncbi:unnamed protein product [Callosobruchus maculatus]|uniref:Uncharacterized protein n=1 Tax=Callosobruchus maculatus TaxID=64391 RepID=A0A653D9Y0_CALMS|nr:unnamed protein product [Callosobruchus maculatus]